MHARYLLVLPVTIERQSQPEVASAIGKKNGMIWKERQAEIIAVNGDPNTDVEILESVGFVMKVARLSECLKRSPGDCLIHPGIA
ncbi:MAG: hypothetical protein ABI644_02820 [Arenimonas sp.]